MSPEQIQKRLKENGITQKMIARRCKNGKGVSDMSVSRIVNKKPGAVSDAIMTEVAKAVGCPKEKVFPEYYLGPRRRRTSKALGPATFAA